MAIGVHLFHNSGRTYRNYIIKLKKALQQNRVGMDDIDESILNLKNIIAKMDAKAIIACSVAFLR
jgi:hypothetical protein